MKIVQEPTIKIEMITDFQRELLECYGAAVTIKQSGCWYLGTVKTPQYTRGVNLDCRTRTHQGSN